MWLRRCFFVLLAGALFYSMAAAAADPAPGNATTPAAKDTLTIDTPILDLLEDPRTRAIVARHLPKLSQRLLQDQSAADLLGESSPRELAIDPHVRGITDEILSALQADLLAAQQASAQ